MTGRHLRKVLAVWLAASLAAPAGAIEVKVPVQSKRSGPGGVGGVGTIGVGPGPAVLAPALSLDLGGSIKLVPGAPALAPHDAPSAMAPAALAPPAAAPDAKQIVFDVRGSRGGHGDVAAAYLTTFDILDRTVGHPDAVTPRVTLIADPTERSILSRLLGRPVRDGDSLFDGHARVYGPQTLPADHPPADLVMTLAAPNGEFSRKGDLRWIDRQQSGEGVIPVTERSAILTQTVFGNTEALGTDVATIMIGGLRLELSHAGLARRDAGVYTDPIARLLRGHARETVGRFVLDEASRTEVPGAAAVTAVLTGEVLAGAQAGLAYGISMKEVKPQFERYLQGLSVEARRTGGSYALFTPSGFSLSDVEDDALRGRITVIEPDRSMPERAEPGRIYIVKTGTLPHPLFVGLMAYSRPPPVLAGDGAMSAALGLGRPFVMTGVEWNQKNIDVFAQRLASRAAPKDRSLVYSVYFDLALEKALQLEALAPAYEEVSRAIPSLTDTMLAAVEAARHAPSAEVPVSRLVEGMRDDVLRASLVAVRSVNGEEEARDMAWTLLRQGTTRERGLVASALMRAGVRRALMLKAFRMVDFYPLNVFAARVALSLGAVRRRA